MSFRCSTR
uniref:(California timema) hypothetical protein n=1 Tax=Timema californicum TaxID=61474 RepID=A0A7R9PFK3_TIMCA|nr:unnamed protein product [Timema californicum]